MPYTKVTLHFIWATKNRQPIISKELKPLLLGHIKENSIKKGIYIDSLNCVEDHIHLLISLGAEQTISKIAMLIKSESSFWVNREKIIHSQFEWQDDYIGSAENVVKLHLACVLNDFPIFVCTSFYEYALKTMHP